MEEPIVIINWGHVAIVVALQFMVTVANYFNSKWRPFVRQGIEKHEELASMFHDGTEDIIRNKAIPGMLQWIEESIQHVFGLIVATVMNIIVLFGLITGVSTVVAFLAAAANAYAIVVLYSIIRKAFAMDDSIHQLAYVLSLDEEPDDENRSE